MRFDFWNWGKVTKEQLVTLVEKQDISHAKDAEEALADTLAKVETKKPRSTQPSVQLPIAGGRSSSPSTVNMMNAFVEEAALVNPDYAIYFIKALEHLAMFNADVSFAVDNIVQLGFTKFNIYLDDKVKDEEKKKILAFLKSRYRNWYGFGEGMGALIRDLLAQVAVTGALSAEAVPSNNLDGIQKVVLVTPKNVRFVYSKLEDTHLPYQNMTGLVGSYNDATNSKIGLRPLNPITYKYAAIRRFNENPYAIPPFLAAMENLAIEKDMMENFRLVIKKLGLLGFLSVLVTAPKQAVGEDNKVYEERMTTYLKSQSGIAENSLSKGYVLGFKNSHEFEMHNTSTNVDGANILMEMNDKRKMAGLKQDPMMLGRNFSTTETLGRVILTKMSSQVSSYQGIVANFLSELFLMDLQLAGYSISFLDVEFDAPLVSDSVKDATAEEIKLRNLTTKYNQGIIGQTDFAQEAGYEEPDQEEPRQLANPSPTAKPKGATDPSTQGTVVTNSQEFLRLSIRATLYEESMQEIAEFDYEDGCGHVHYTSLQKDFTDIYRMSKDTELLATYLDQYFEATVTNYNSAVEKVTRQLVTVLAELPATSTIQQVTDMVFTHLYTKWSKEFTSIQKKTVNKYVEAAYKAFRTDKSVFNGSELINGKPLPSATFELLDFRAIDYHKKSDELYLGKFITDKDTKKKITSYIKKAYLEENTPIGNNQAGISSFKAAFPEVLLKEEWKIARILNTTVNHMRNSAALNYLNQAEVTKFEIRGVVDRLQCDWCKSIQGKTFTVGTALTKLERQVTTSPDFIGEVSPFINKVFKDSSVLSSMSGDDIQVQGIALPPLHSNCRDVIIAVL